MTEPTTDTAPAPVVDLDRMRAAVPNYQWGELPKRLRRDWPYPVEGDQEPQDPPAETQAIQIDAREYWQLQRAE